MKMATLAELFKKDRGFLFIFSLYIFFFLADIVTTAMNNDLLVYIESNPFYKFGGLFGIYLLNILLIVAIYWIYKTGNDTYRFMLIHLMVVTVAVRVLAVRNALKWYFMPEEVAVVKAAAIPAGFALKTFIVLNLLVYMVFVLAIISFLIWKIDHNTKRKK